MIPRGNMGMEVVAYGVPPYDPLVPDELRDFGERIRRATETQPATTWIVAQPTTEQIVSSLMLRLQPALDELHARLDKIEARLPLTSEERDQLESVRALVAKFGGKVG